jgi:hypothetical protein
MPYYICARASCRARARARLPQREGRRTATSYPVSGGRLGDDDIPVVGTFAEIRTMGAPSTRMG